MTSIERVAPQDINGLQFYVSKDGKHKGSSQEALSLMSGVAKSTMYAHLLKLEKGEVKGLEHLQGKVFHRSLTNENNVATIVTSEAMAEVIEYYAFTSKAANDTARTTYRKFAKMGIDKWILDLTGYKSELDNTEVLAVMNTILTEVKELRADIKEYHDIRQVTVNIYPNVDTFLDKLPGVKTITSSKELVTVKEWLAAKGISLEFNRLIAFGRQVSDVYKSTTNCEAQNKMVKVNGKFRNVGKGYSSEYLPILDMAWQQFQN